MTLLRLRYLTLKLRALCLVLRRLRAGRLSCPWLTPLGQRHVPLGYMILANWFVSRGRFLLHARLYLASNTLKGSPVPPNGKSFGHLIDLEA